MPADLPAIISRYANGESIQTLAAENAVHRATLYRWMLAGIGDNAYHEVVTHCLTQRVAEADGRLESAVDACDIARAREQAKFARMDLERRRPALYGVRTQVDVNVDIGAALQELSERLAVAQSPTAMVEGEALRITDVTSSGFDATQRQHGGPEREQQSAGSSPSAADHDRK